MAIQWTVKNKKGLGKGYKNTVELGAKRYGAGSLYKCKRVEDYGRQYHQWHCYVRKFFGLFGKGEFFYLTYKREDDGVECGAGYISAKDARILSPGDPLP